MRENGSNAEAQLRVERKTGVRVQFFCEAATVCARKVRKKLYSDPGFTRVAGATRGCTRSMEMSAIRLIT